MARATRPKFTRFCFKGWTSPALHLANVAQCAVSSIVPIYKGYVVLNAVKKIEIRGYDVYVALK